MVPRCHARIRPVCWIFGWTTPEVAALAQPTRLAVFRLLMTYEPDGLPAGDVARQLDVPHNTMSTHLGILSRAGLIRATRHSRSIVYRAKPEAVAALASFLVKDCCRGRPDVCA